MTSTRVLAALALVAPLSVAAQVSYSQATITGERLYFRDVPRICAERNDQLWDRKASLDQDLRDLDRDGGTLDQMKRRLDADYRNLDWGNNAAIGAYNARSEEYNRLIAAHNARVANMNRAASMLNGDSADLVGYCNSVLLAR
jgi:hypothetical protein